MSYLVMARKYRPTRFEEVSGQTHVVRTLKNALEQDRTGHAYLFCGPRGVGKTTIARLFARELNDSFDGSLESSLAVREIDGASHNSVDHVRELVETFRTLPPPGVRYKVYIIDEVHMLSTSAFNALLKSLEEPPPHTVFILATTEPHKIPMTVISRCQRFDFRALSIPLIIEKLQRICADQGITADRSGLRVIARLADGSMRDAESLLDRVVAYTGTTLSSNSVAESLGVVGQDPLLSIIDSIMQREPKEALVALDLVLDTGCDISLFLRDFVDFWRDLLILKSSGKEYLLEKGEYDEQSIAKLEKIIAAVNLEDVIDIVQLAREGADRVLRSSFARAALEALLVRLSTREPAKALSEVIKELTILGNSANNAGIAHFGVSKALTADSSKETAPKEKKVEKQSHEQSQDDKEPDWNKFVSSVEKKGYRLLSEHLRRVAATEFNSSRVVLSGAAFVVEYLRRSEVRERLFSLLKESFQAEPNIIFEEVGSTEAGKTATSKAHTIESIERASAAKKRSELLEGVLSEPAVQALKKVFPGSEIEKIVVRKKREVSQNNKKRKEHE